MLERKFKFLVTVLDTPDGEEKIVFPSYEDFYKTLTPERMEILSVLSERKVNSVSELAEILRRDYKNGVITLLLPPKFDKTNLISQEEHSVFAFF